MLSLVNNFAGRRAWLSTQNLLRFSCLVLAICMGGLNTASALSAAQSDAYAKGTYYFNTEDNSCSGAAVGGDVGTVTTDASTTKVAQTIMGIAKTDKLGERGALIGLMVGLAESGLRNLSNSNVPVSLNNPAANGVGKDHDSVGVFQQRPSTGWSTIANGTAADGNKDAVWQLMDPAYAAEAFFGSPPGANAPGALSKGVQNVSNWQSLDPWVVAQKVQGSAFSDGSNYKNKIASTQSLLSQYWASAPAVALPVAVTGGSNTSTGTNSMDTSGCAAVSITCNAGSVTTGESTVRQNVVCLAQAELALWKSGQMHIGNPTSAKDTSTYGKYSEGLTQLWCADFASWIYKQSGYPIGSGNNWRVAAVADIKVIGQRGQKFHWHSADGGYVPQPGDLAIHDVGESHVNIVTAVKGRQVTMIGGDQSAPSGGYPSQSKVSEYSVSSFNGDHISGYVSPD